MAKTLKPHTAIPWKFGTGNNCHDIYDTNGAKVCQVFENLSDRFVIVRAVNSHAALVEALEAMIAANRSSDVDDWINAQRQARDALDLAKESL